VDYMQLHITSIAYGNDLSAVVFYKEMLILHFVKCLQQKMLTEFSANKSRRPKPSKALQKCVVLSKTVVKKWCIVKTVMTGITLNV